jgi:DNA-binding XRE family transcriptional regulator
MKPPPPYDFGRNLQMIREAAALNMEQLALKARLSSVTICNLESGKNQPSLWSAFSIARALKVSLQELCADKE